MKQDLLKKGLLYWLKIQTNVIFVVLICSVLTVIVRFFTHDRLTQDLITGVLGLIFEFSFSIWTFYKLYFEDKTTIFNFLSPLFLALPLHLIISLITQFSGFICGFGPSALGGVIGSMMAGEYIWDFSKIPWYLFSIPFVFKLILIALGTYIGCLLAMKHEIKPKTIQQSIT